MSIKDYEYIYYIVWGDWDGTNDITPIFAHSDAECGRYIKSNDNIMFSLAEFYLCDTTDPIPDIGKILRKEFGTLMIEYDELDINNKNHKKLVRKAFKHVSDKEIINHLFAYNQDADGCIVSLIKRKVSKMIFVNRKKKYKTLFEIPKNPRDITIIHQS